MHSMRHSLWATRPLLALALTACGGIGGAVDGSADNGEDVDLQAPYRHPLQGVTLVDGQVPLVERKDSPDGRRYAIYAGGSQVHDEPVQRTSGVMTVERRTMTVDERLQAAERKRLANGGVAPQRLLAPAPVVGPSLERSLAEASAKTPFHTTIRLHELPGPTLTHEVNLAVARGEVVTTGDYYDVRAGLVAARQDRIAHHREAVVDAIEALGGHITSVCTNMVCLSATLTRDQVQALSRHPEVSRIDLDLPATPNGPILGDDIREGTQLDQFLDHGYDGDVVPGVVGRADVRVSVMEVGGYAPHVGYTDGVDRRVTMFTCLSIGCGSAGSFADPDDHAAAVAGLIVGDLTLGQDPTVPLLDDQEKLSGYGTGGRAYLYGDLTWSAPFQSAVDHVLDRRYVPSLNNASMSIPGDDDACLGQSTLSRAVNDLFEAGVLPIQSAGNDGESATDCLIGSPASAIGTFTVGGHGDWLFGGIDGDVHDVRYADIYPDSAQGGVSEAEGLNRTIVDMTAFAYRMDMFDASGGYDYAPDAGGTSFSAPTVSGAAVELLDFYRTEYSSYLDANPGVLYTTLLLMGDRNGAAGSLTSYFDNRWGAGRLKMRKPDEGGMDAPWGFHHGETCVDDGMQVFIPINGGVIIPSDVESLTAAIYWYDPQHELGTGLDDVDLFIKDSSGFSVGSSGDPYDNKERAHVAGVGSQTLDLMIEGWDVTGDDTGCGTDSVRVYWAYMFEDSDRDDADGPGDEIEPL